MKKNNIIKTCAITGGSLVALSGSAMAQAGAAESAITSEIATMITAGNGVGVAALGLFAAAAVFGVVKRFFSKGK